MENKLVRGFLILKDNGRYGVITKELTSGYPVEIFIDGKLIKGNIESRFIDSKQEYYLLGENGKSYFLKNNMEVLVEE